jgi:hypothetical protein
MMARVRRFVLLVAVALWQGGFVFYAGVVVPTGTDLHGHFGQGLVTQRVTHWLNLFGLLTHVAYFWELRATDERRRWKWWLWGASLALLNALAFLHLKMDSLVDATAREVADGFRGWHIAYLWASTGQWLIAAVLAWATVSDRREAKPGA